MPRAGALLVLMRPDHMSDVRSVVLIAPGEVIKGGGGGGGGECVPAAVRQSVLTLGR